MQDRLTWEQICEQFPDEWVVVVDGDWVRDRPFGLKSAIVCSHHRRRKDAYAKAKLVIEQVGTVGCFWTGRIDSAVRQ